MDLSLEQHLWVPCSDHRIWREGGQKKINSWSLKREGFLKQSWTGESQSFISVWFLVSKFSQRYATVSHGDLHVHQGSTSSWPLTLTHTPLPTHILSLALFQRSHCWPESGRRSPFVPFFNLTHTHAEALCMRKRSGRGAGDYDWWLWREILSLSVNTHKLPICQAYPVCLHVCAWACATWRSLRLRLEGRQLESLWLLSWLVTDVTDTDTHSHRPAVSEGALMRLQHLSGVTKALIYSQIGNAINK